MDCADESELPNQFFFPAERVDRNVEPVIITLAVISSHN
jgi:hypothetical protein